MNSGSNGVMGTLSTHTSSREELLNDPVVCGTGEPTHTPQRACQLYIELAGLSTMYYWAKGVWSSTGIGS